MTTPIGLKIYERDAADAASVVPASITDTGLLIESERGIPHKPTRVTSLAQAIQRFGGYDVSKYYGMLAVRGLFRNLGNNGINLYLSRVLSDAGDYAEAIVDDLVCGSTKLESRIAGVDGDNIDITISTGSVSGKKVTVEVTSIAKVKKSGGWLSGDVTLPYDSALGILPTAGVIKVESEYIKYTGRTDTELTGCTRGYAGTEASAHPDATAIDILEVFDNLSLTVFAEAINSGHTGIYNSDPSCVVRVVQMGSALPANAAKTSMTGGSVVVKSSLTVAGEVTTTTVIGAGQYGIGDPGVWGNKLRLSISVSEGLPSYRNLAVYLKDANGEYQLVETWNQLTKSTMAPTINNAATGSSYIYIKTAGELPDAVAVVDLVDGSDGSATDNDDYIGDPSKATGLYAFDSTNVRILACIDNNTKEVAKSLEEYCATRGTIIALCTPPYATSLTTLENEWKDYLMKTKSYLSGYRGWVQVSDGFGGTAWIPALGHIIGAAYIRKMIENGGYPHIAPAGMSTTLADCLDIEFTNYSEADLSYLVHTLGFNAIMFMPGAGFIVRTSRTFSSLSKWYSVHTRRSANYIKSCYMENFSWVEQEPNNENTRSRLTRSALKFLGDLYNRGMFETRGGFENNVSFKCDEDNNPIQVVNQRKLVADNVVRFVEVAETVEINFMNTREGIIVTDN